MWSAVCLECLYEFSAIPKILQTESLTHRGWDKKPTNFLMTFSNAFSWMEICRFPHVFVGLKNVPTSLSPTFQRVAPNRSYDQWWYVNIVSGVDLGVWVHYIIATPSMGEPHVYIAKWGQDGIFDRACFAALGGGRSALLGNFCLIWFWHMFALFSVIIFTLSGEWSIPGSKLSLSGDSVPYSWRELCFI